MFKRLNLKYLAYHDTLTGLKNRNYLKYKMNYKKFKYLYFVDINNLKQYNIKSYSNGDLHIVYCIYSVSNIVSKKDVFIRYGGDEFLLFTNEKYDLKSGVLYSVGFMELKNCKNLEYCIDDSYNDMLKNKSLK